MEEGPPRKADSQAQQGMMGITDITKEEGGSRFMSISTGEISGMGGMDPGMDVVQALRASLASKHISDENYYFVILE